MRHWMKKTGSFAMACALILSMVAVSAKAAQSNQLVQIDLWHAAANKASMGNVATDNNKKALYNPEKNTLQIATNPVSVSGYQSAITKIQYDQTGKGSYTDAKILSTGTVETGTKNDGINHTVTYISSFEIQLPSYITHKGVEYIPLQMVVPYTPMDEVVGEGALSSRLRIDWDQIDNSSLTQIKPDNTMSSGEVENIDRTDAKSGVQLQTDSAKVATTTEFVVETVTSGSDYTLAQKAVSGNFTLYRIKLLANGKETEPYGAVTLVFPYSKPSAMYRISNNDSKTVLRGTDSDNGYEVMTTKVGLFAVVGGTKITVTKPVTPAVPSNNNGNSNADTAFTDITNHWARASIIRATNEGLFSGTSTTTFSPQRTMTSAMVVTVLYRMAGSPAVTLPDSLPNVQVGAWHEIASAWAYEKGIIGGYKTYQSDQPVSRQELATMLYRFYALNMTPAAGADLSKFTDASSVAAWAKDGVAWANTAGIVSGTSATTLSPNGSATRAQVATMLCRYLDYAK